MIRGDEALPRRLHHRGVAQVLEAIAEAPRDGAGAQVQALHALPADARGRELPQDVQDLERGDAARRARREGQVHVAITPVQRRLHDDAVAGQVLAPDEAGVGGHVVHDGLRDGAAIERVRPVLGDQLQAAREIGIAHAICREHARRPMDPRAVAQVILRRHRVRRELLHELGVVEGEIPVGLEAVAGQRNGRGQDVAQRHRAVALQGQGQAGDGPGHGDGAVAVLVGGILRARPREEAVRDAADDLVDRLVRGQRGHAVEVERDGLAALGQVDEHRAGAGDGGHERLHHRHREGGGHGGVHGVAAAGEDGGAHLGAARMLGGHHGVGGERRVLGDDDT